MNTPVINFHDRILPGGIAQPRVPSIYRMKELSAIGIPMTGNGSSRDGFIVAVIEDASTGRSAVE